MRTSLLPLAALFLLALAGSALAVDGVIEINQTCALQTGCFAGDTPGYPVTITVSDSYRLTSNLRRTIQLGGSQNADFILITADDVSLDLGGFQIVCTTPLGGQCSGAGSGVAAPFEPPVTGTSVKNGSIRGMAFSGVSLGDQSRVSGLRVRSSGTDGIRVGEGSSVSGNTVYLNDEDGIHASSGSTVSGNTAHQNGDDGIFAEVGSTVSGNTAHENGGDGIFANSGSTVSGNTASSNGGNGISAVGGSTVSDNTAYLNGGAGIKALEGSAVHRNTVRRNGGCGLFLFTIFTPDAAYRENVITTTGSCTVMNGLNAGDNVCNGTTTCP